MALQYALYIETALDPKQAIERLFEAIGIQTYTLLSERPGVYASPSGPAFVTLAYKMPDEGRAFLVEELGIEASVIILFRLNDEDREAQKYGLLQATIALLQRIPGDALLLFNGEVVWLFRKEGILTLNSGMELWTPTYLSLVEGDYVMKDIPIL